ncbi:hypothetical protein ACH5RR_014877 [Cinchona calisaya]|uniref:Pectinesterase n=1 Tax=Cinchona calisaya TaxID=153742 RepID=A0ABD2ZRY9_9GENT
MANTHQPLLDTPKKRSTSFKLLYAVLSLATIICAIAIVSLATFKTSQTTSLKAHLCTHAQHDQSSCLAVVSEVSSPSDGLMQSSTDADILQMILAKSSSQIQETIELTNKINQRVNDQKSQAALADCLELMEMSVDRLMDSMVALGSQNLQSHFSDAHSWLSSVLTNHFTCVDGLDGQAKTIMEPMMKELIARARTSLAILVAIAPTKEEIMLQKLNENLPSWITSKDRRLLESLPKDIKANSVVAKDGSGNYKTVQDAVNAAPNNTQTRYVIYVKAGTYQEKVDIGTSKKNLMLVGDGMNITIITGSLNVVDGSTTFNSATLAAVGDGFIAQDLCFQNTAGPQKHQAVALRLGADKSVINRCKIDAYQDTLYAHSLRQFYRDSYITGTVDFIFGDAAVVLQKCQLVARKPMTGQQNMVTAQGRTDPNSITGTSIQNCDIIASSDLAPVKGSIKTYLGRPWQAYSRTVVMESNIGDHIDPAGWSVWDGDLYLKTLYYGEYQNAGPGAGTRGRVKWARVISTADATKFTVAQFIQGGQWLKDTGVTYTEGL